MEKPPVSLPGAFVRNRSLVYNDCASTGLPSFPHFKYGDLTPQYLWPQPLERLKEGPTWTGSLRSNEAKEWRQKMSDDASHVAGNLISFQ
jgi:hypothetical protein